SPNDPTNPEDPTVRGPNGPSGTGPEPTGADQDTRRDAVLPGAPLGHHGPYGTTEVTATEGVDRTVTLVDPPDESGADGISQSDPHQETQRSNLDYAMRVIVGRALPDVRDGLNPVHRRIVYAMFDGGHRPARSYSKCAKVVG